MHYEFSLVSHGPGPPVPPWGFAESAWRAVPALRLATGTAEPQTVWRWFQGRPSNTRLNGVSVARRNVLNPASWATSRSPGSPACAPRAAPTSWDSDAGVQTSVETQ